jgi:hypothetical protein
MTAEISTPDSNPNDELVDAELSRLANGIREQHRLAEEKVASGLMHALNAGTMLAQAKERLPHGDFEAWVEEHVQVTQRQAQRYMRAVRRWGEIESKATCMSLLSLNQCLDLITEPRSEPERRTSKDPRPGRLPAPGHKLTASAKTDDGKIKVLVEPYTDSDFVYLTAIDESGVADFYQRPVRRKYAYFALESMRPDIEFDTLEWSEEPAESRSGDHEWHRPRWRYPDTGDERLNQLEAAVAARLKDRDAADAAIAEIARDRLFEKTHPDLESYLQGRLGVRPSEYGLIVDVPGMATA